MNDADDVFVCVLKKVIMLLPDLLDGRKGLFISHFDPFILLASACSATPPAKRVSNPYGYGRLPLWHLFISFSCF
ncbi:hypothetical protein L1987_60786 [Smallanthus sonchifolius]|uniref:Uncharacterized protein n=1 Tax=Smallanthus sonchifolius TaxID=185202 RepID=A0ACB9D9E5_9ASTR|nr:hypothetical protein L1987_60786 [Smallanthus sonchifolius]